MASQRADFSQNGKSPLDAFKVLGEFLRNGFHDGHQAVAQFGMSALQFLEFFHAFFGELTHPLVGNTRQTRRFGCDLLQPDLVGQQARGNIVMKLLHALGHVGGGRDDSRLCHRRFQ